MNRKWLIILSLAFILSPACNLQQRERELQQREDSLNQKEQELSLKEKTLQLKEEELAKREKKLDSSSLNDSTFVYDPALVGQWSVKMTNTESTCPGSAVGDIKVEQWNISYQNNKTVAKAIAGDKLVRVYSGNYIDNTTIQLVEDNISTAAQPATRMVVRLRMVNPTTMEGQREIIREGECKVTYALQLNKQ